jgi:hypothetical protein
MNSKEINNFIFLEDNKLKLSLLWSYLIIVFFMVIVIIITFYDCELFYKNNGLIINIDNSYYVKLYAKEADIYKINNKELLVDNDKYSYIIKSISNEYYFDNNTSTNYREIVLSIKLPHKYLIENNVVDINIKYKKTKLIKHIYNSMFGKEK